MKKGLIGTSALVAATFVSGAAFAQESGAPTLSMSGYFETEYTIIDEDSDRTTNLADGTRDGIDGDGIDHDSFIIFNVEGTADNGLTYGGRVDWEASSHSIDEHYIYFSGGWGRLHMGADDGIVDNTVVGGESVLAGGFLFDGSTTPDGNVAAQGDYSIGGPSLAAETGDSPKFTYYSPNFSGFSFGASYTPDASLTDATDNPVATNGLGGGASYEGALNYAGDFDGIGIAAGIGYINTDSGEGQEDNHGIRTGLTVSFAGFSVGLGYGDHFDSGCAEADVDCEGDHFYSVGANYSFGPAVIYGGYFTSEEDPAGAGDGTDEHTEYGFGVDYTVAEGLNTWAEVMWTEGESAAANDVNETDGTRFLLGTGLSF